MQNYSKILVAIELYQEEDKKLMDKAVEFSRESQSEIFLVHAVEDITTYSPMAYPGMNEARTEILKEHEENIKKLAADYQVPESHIHLEFGPPGLVVKEAAEKIQPSLLVVGSHSRHGLELLFGTMTDSILHHTSCDVFVVSLPKRA